MKRTFTAGILTCALFALPALAADPPKPSAAPVAEYDEKTQTFDLTLPEGSTLMSYFRTIEEAAKKKGTHVSFIIDPRAGRIRMPEIRLKKAGLCSLAELLEHITGQISAMNKDLASEIVMGVNPLPDGIGFIVSIELVQSDDEVRSSVFNLTYSKTPPEKIISAVDAALSLDSSIGKPTIKFHVDSSLLFVRGTDLQRETVMQVMQALGVPISSDAPRIWTGISAAPSREQQKTEFSTHIITGKQFKNYHDNFLNVYYPQGTYRMLADGGLQIRDLLEGAEIRKYGLRPGDIVHKVNGEAVTLSNIAELFQAAAPLSEHVIAGERDGKPFEIRISVKR